MDKLEKLNKLAEKAEAEIREKRILGGMELFNLKKEKYVVFIFHLEKKAIYLQSKILLNNKRYNY